MVGTGITNACNMNDHVNDVWMDLLFIRSVDIIHWYDMA